MLSAVTAVGCSNWCDDAMFNRDSSSQFTPDDVFVPEEDSEKEAMHRRKLGSGGWCHGAVA